MTEIRRLARGQVALDLGTGPQAVLAVEAALAGATLVYAVEMDAQSARMATEHVKDLESVGKARGGRCVFADRGVCAAQRHQEGAGAGTLRSDVRPRP
jgi:predicted RNA methylase